jgi:aldehyde:ferredoxin oxidoreductase
MKQTAPPVGNILEIDLTAESVRFRSYPHQTIGTFLTGRGFNTAYLFAHLKKGVDPLGPRNLLVLTCGLLTGQAAPASTRLHVNALSPLTGLLGSSNIGGDVGPWLRSCGIQSLIIRGRAAHPLYLLIERDRVSFKDAAALWGLDTWQTQTQIEQRIGPDRTRSLVIGPAGENGVLYACIMSGKDHAAGRTGMGAVMGAKQLKAIAVVRTGDAKRPKPSAAERAAVASYTKKIMASPDFKIFKTYGGAGYVKWADDQGIMATRNYRQARFEGAGRIDGRLLKPYRVKAKGCRGCPVQCKAELDFADPALAERPLMRPEFEPMINLGPKCGLDDLKALVEIDNLCSRLGIDNISAGGAIAFAMDLYDRGLLTQTDCGGLDLKWGNASAMRSLVEQIAAKAHLGAILALGVRQAAALIGKGSHRYAAHVKGLELAAYHPGAIMGSALGYAMAGRGGDYSSVYAAMEYNWTPEKAAAAFGSPNAVKLQATQGKAPMVKRAMIVNAVLDCLGMCKVPALSMIGTFDLREEAKLTAAVCGLQLSAGQLMNVGERIVHMERWLNLRFGATDDDDCLPEMFSDPAYTPLGPIQAQAAEKVTRMRSEFYAEMGWDHKGRPTRAQRRTLCNDVRQLYFELNKGTKEQETDHDNYSEGDPTDPAISVGKRH